MPTRISNRCPTRMPARVRAVLLGLFLVVAFTGTETLLAAGAERRSFDIPSGALSQALVRFAGAAGVMLSADARLTDGKQSPGLQGEFTVDEGLATLLAGSGLAPLQNADGSYTLRPTGDALDALMRRARQPLDLAEAEAQPAPRKPSGSATAELPEMTVTAKPTDETSYTVPNATTATKTDTPIFDTPVSIQVVPYSVIQDQKGYQLKDALENVSGVRPNPVAGYAEIFIIRGFRNGSALYRNGLQLNFTTLDTATAESIEVLKGPAAVLYGRVEPGGLINLVTKKPLGTPYYSFEQRFGSYDFYRTEWDATGPITQDGAFLYRFVGAYQNSDSFRDFTDLERVLLYPSATWRISDATEWTVDLEALRDDTHIDAFGLPAIGNRPAPTPIGRSFQDPAVSRSDIDRVRLGSNFTHRFNDSWTLLNRFLYATNDHSETDFYPVGLRSDNRTLDRVASHYFLFDDFYQTNLDLTGKFKIWGTEHETLVGFDYRLFLREGKFTFTTNGFDNPPPALAIDIFNPRYGIDPAVFDRSNLTRPDPLFRRRDEWKGVYFQDHITLWDKLHILGGGRYDWTTIEESDVQKLKESEFSPRVGILYQPWRWVSVYGSWARSFGAGSNITGAGQVFPPETGEQFEVGLKTQLLDERITGTLAFYHLTKQNILTADLSTPDPLDGIAIGEARSQGVELDIAGRLTDQLSLIGSYAYTDAEVTKDDGGLERKRLPNAPRNAGSLWLKYDVNGYAADGLSFGLGVFAAGQRQGDVQNTFQLPGYVRLDATAGYRMTIGPTRVTTQLNIRNLLDKTYYENADTGTNSPPRLSIWPGAPLTVLGSIRVEF